MKIRNIPFGYQFDNGKIISHPVESQIVSNIYENYLQGSSLLQIAKKLNACGAEYMPGVTGWNKARLKRKMSDTLEMKHIRQLWIQTPSTRLRRLKQSETHRKLLNEVR